MTATSSERAIRNDPWGARDAGTDVRTAWLLKLARSFPDSADRVALANYYANRMAFARYMRGTRAYGHRSIVAEALNSAAAIRRYLYTLESRSV